MPPSDPFLASPTKCPRSHDAADIRSKKERSTVMGAIRSHGNAATELRLIALFRPSTAA
jgi:hypothetical protein